MANSIRKEIAALNVKINLLEGLCNKHRRRAHRFARNHRKAKQDVKMLAAELGGLKARLAALEDGGGE